MKRRTFIKRSSIMTLPILINGMGISALSRRKYSELFGGSEDRVLVLVNLVGGNDTLNTLLPLEYYDNLAKVRPNVIIPENKLLKLTDEVGMHPVMGAMKDIYEEGRLRIIRAVGYPNQNRSHFRSSDIWHTGSKSKEYKQTGWLGDYLNDQHPGYPDNYPNDDYPDPLAITISPSAAENCQAKHTNYSFALTSTSNLGGFNENVNYEVPDNCFGKNLEFMRESYHQSNVYSGRLQEAYDKGTNLSDLYPDDNRLGKKLKLIARLLSGGLKTKVFVVSQGGYDTHSFQVEESDVTTGRHARLLTELSNAIQAFQDDINQLGLEKRVLGMTISEFGRRIRSNASNGTDHGDAVGLFVFGECVHAGLLGDNPEISNDVSKNEAVPYQFDFRSVYGSILVDWMGASEEYVREHLYEDFVKLPIVKGCSSVSTVDVSVVDPLDVRLTPNPAQNQVTVSWKGNGVSSTLLLCDEMGGIIRTMHIRQDESKGLQSRQINLTSLPSGVYFVKLIEGHLHKVKRLVKI